MFNETDWNELLLEMDDEPHILRDNDSNCIYIASMGTNFVNVCEFDTEEGERTHICIRKTIWDRIVRLIEQDFQDKK